MRCFSKTVFLLLAVVCSANPIFAQGSDPGPFQGFWQVAEAAGDHCVMIIKRGNRASCFWVGSATDAVQKGDWEIQGKWCVITWESGYRDVLSLQEDQTLLRRSFRPDQELTEEPDFVARAVPMDPRIPGSLAVDRQEFTGSDEETPAAVVPPETQRATEEAPSSPIPPRSPYIGFWKARQSSGFMGIGGGRDEFYLQLSRGGKARIAFRNWGGDADPTGRWEVVGDTARIHWPDGKKDIIRPSSEGYELLELGRKDDFGDRPDNRRKIVKGSPEELERYFKAAEVNLTTLNDFVGTWAPVDPKGVSTVVEVERWGNARRYPVETVAAKGAESGKWRLEGNNLVIRWEDDSSDVLRIGVRFFIREIFAPGEPVTGTPLAMVPVKRIDQARIGPGF